MRHCLVPCRAGGGKARAGEGPVQYLGQVTGCDEEGRRVRMEFEGQDRPQWMTVEQIVLDYR